MRDSTCRPRHGPNYDVSPDGQRFLMLKPIEQAQAAPTQINVVLNWFEELKQKVPTGKSDFLPNSPLIQFASSGLNAKPRRSPS